MGEDPDRSADGEPDPAADGGGVAGDSPADPLDEADGADDPDDPDAAADGADTVDAEADDADAAASDDQESPADGSTDGAPFEIPEVRDYAAVKGPTPRSEDESESGPGSASASDDDPGGEGHDGTGGDDGEAGNEADDRNGTPTDRSTATAPGGDAEITVTDREANSPGTGAPESGADETTQGETGSEAGPDDDLPAGVEAEPLDSPSPAAPATGSGAETGAGTETGTRSPGTAGSAGGATPSADEGILEGPESDEEMPLAEHIEEMMRRLGVVFLFGGVAMLIAFPTAPEAIDFLWSYHIPEPAENRPRLYGPLELVLTRLKVAGLAGIVVGLPVFVYQSYRFMRPGLYPKERKYYLAAVPTSLVLATIGVLFAHFIVLPAIFAYFTAYTTGSAVIAFGLAETFNLMIVLMSFMAIVFQIPLFIMLAIMMNLVTRLWLEDKRLIFWGTFLGIAFIFSPDPTGMAPIIVTLTMIALYEGTLALLRWTGN